MYDRLVVTGSKKKKTNRKPGWQKEAAEYDAWLKKHGAHPTQRKSKKVQVVELPGTAKTFIRETPKYKSLSTPNSDTSVKKTHEYTGDYFVGIATMHKSNLVPVGKDTDAKEYATMRRN